MGPRMVRVQLELGGKDPHYVTEDVEDVTAVAAALADGAMYNAGQSCCSVERIYVHDRVHDAFVEALTASTESFRVGDPRDPDTYLGPLALPNQPNFLQAQVNDALAKGATLHCGGELLPETPRFYPPTVLSGTNHTMRLMTEECFGPVVGVMRVGSDDEAVERMNDTEFGLTAGVWTRDEERAHQILGRVKTGTAYWNCCDRVSPYLPWSGRQGSGIGVTLSTFGIEAFTQCKAYHLRK